MNYQNVERFNAHLRSLGIGAALLSSPFTLTWLTGYAPPIQTGPSPFEGGPAIGWWRGGELTVVLSDEEAEAAQDLGVDVRDYVGFSVEEPLDTTERQASVLRELLEQRGKPRGMDRGGAELSLRCSGAGLLRFLPRGVRATARRSHRGPASHQEC
jgi:hypothetical protein